MFLRLLPRLALQKGPHVNEHPELLSNEGRLRGEYDLNGAHRPSEGQKARKIRHNKNPVSRVREKSRRQSHVLPKLPKGYVVEGDAQEPRHLGQLHYQVVPAGAVEP